MAKRKKQATADGHPMFPTPSTTRVRFLSTTWFAQTFTTTRAIVTGVVGTAVGLIAVYSGINYTLDYWVRSSVYAADKAQFFGRMDYQTNEIKLGQAQMAYKLAQNRLREFDLLRPEAERRSVSGQMYRSALERDVESAAREVRVLEEALTYQRSQIHQRR